jgi:hypothetical protein
VASVATATEAIQAMRRLDRITTCAGAPCVGIEASIVLVTLAKRVHTGHRAVALSSGVGEDVRGGARGLWTMDMVVISAQLGGAKLYELGEIEIRGFVAERQECFETRRGDCVQLDGVGEGRDMVNGSGRGAKVGQYVVIPAAASEISRA